jgi:hypothetical protein
MYILVAMQIDAVVAKLIVAPVSATSLFSILLPVMPSAFIL